MDNEYAASKGVIVIDTANVTERDLAKFSPSIDDIDILNQILTALRNLEPPSQERMLNTVATFLGLGQRHGVNMSTVATPHLTSTNSQESLFSEDRSISPKQFMLEKQPRTDV